MPEEMRRGLVPLAEMTVAEKLCAMEEIWSDLESTPDQVPSPAWHGDVLRARKSRVCEGSSEYSDWSEAKQRIRARANT